MTSIAVLGTGQICYNASTMPEFEIIDHTADTAIVAYGDNMEELFINAARGTMSLVADLEKVEPVVSHVITAEAANQEELLVAWINELLYLFDAEELIFSRFVIDFVGTDHVKATGYGEKVDASRHDLRTQVKAATYHELEINATDGYRAHIILDV
ncbi:MAG: archease [Dehalococcoidia bacterium]